MWTRRAFLRSSGLSVFGLTLGGVPGFLTRAAHAAPSGIQSKRPILVTIFQRGAMDGVMAVQPLADADLQQLRPGLLLPVGGENGLIDLDGRFGIHPRGSALASLYKQGKLAVVHGIGSPEKNRSHFDAQDYMESGTPGQKSTSSGWLNRAVGLTGHEHSAYQAVAMTSSMPRMLSGSVAALAVGNLEEFQVRAGAGADSLESLYAQATGGKTGQLLSKRGSEAFEATKVLSPQNIRSYQPANQAQYPNGNLGRGLRQVAQLIKTDVGLEVAFVEHNGWDTHVAQGTGQGTFGRLFQELSGSIAAFWQDLGPDLQQRVTLMTMTEFGRTVHQNGSNGTDHGRGSCMFVLGSNVKGGKVYGQVTSFSKDALEDGRDLPVSTDFRALFSNVATRHLHLPAQNDQLFPGWRGSPLTVV
ncbi:DUF1501 domain-containing protein [bacterium]|nr:DUF1501 domain-containing protein [bacterium]